MRSSQGRDDAGRRDLPNAVIVAGVGNVEIPIVIDREAEWFGKARFR
jgi:hypothetical protein